MIGIRGRASRRFFPLFVAVLVGIGLAQIGGRIRMGTEHPPEPIRAFQPYRGDVDRDSRQDVIAYARTLRFTEAAGVGDEQRLIVDGDSVGSPGPLVRVEPLLGINASGREAVANGLIVARFLNRDTIPYPPLAIGARDTTYWWTDSVVSGRWRSLYFSSDPAIPPVEWDLTLEQLQDEQHDGLQSSARWMFTNEGEKPWVVCGAGTACRAHRARDY